MTIQDYPVAGTEQTPPLELVADYAYYQLLLDAPTKQAALDRLFALTAKLAAMVAELYPAGGWLIFCPFDRTILGYPDPDGTAWCPTCAGRVDAHGLVVRGRPDVRGR